MKFSIAGNTDVGCVRSANEDSIAWTLAPAGDAVLCVVCDGMGGYRGGAIASRTAVDVFLRSMEAPWKALQTGADRAAKKLLRAAATAANAAVREQRQADPELAQMGTTLVACAAGGGRLHLINAGDSRCYRLRDGQWQQLTHDDSMAQMLADEGEVAVDDPSLARFQHILTKALGVEEDIEFSLFSAGVQPGDQLLLCSDGLYNALAAEALPQALRRTATPEEKVEQLLADSLAAGASDNVSLILLTVDE